MPVCDLTITLNETFYLLSYIIIFDKHPKKQRLSASIYSPHSVRIPKFTSTTVWAKSVYFLLNITVYLMAIQSPIFLPTSTDFGVKKKVAKNKYWHCLQHYKYSVGFKIPNKLINFFYAAQ